MERRNFLRTLVGGVAVAAAARTWPFRVYSFPSEPITQSLIVGDSSMFYEGQMIAIYGLGGLLPNANYEIVSVDHAAREVEFKTVHQSILNWKSLSRSPQPSEV